MGFEYNGVRFAQDNLNIFPGLCAVDNKQNVEQMMKALKEHNLSCTRMGVYKPRTSPYAFQGLGKPCLDYVFELAGEYGIKVIAMEVTHERHIHEIQEILDKLNHPCGVMLQVGTRNAQNFELLRAIGSQQTFPILFKRGFGISLNESLSAAEYLAHSGNSKVIFCLRGMKSLSGNPHRNLADFAHIPVIKRLTIMPVCIDPSHSIGCLESAPDKMNDIFHATAQGIVAGANMVLVDFHPNPSQAAVDAKQALSLKALEWYLEDIQIAREAYLKRKQCAEKYV
jgi:3-deoxy-7-phosphoheptulonate synthase